jgi:tryptophan synthase alpha chain
LTELPVGVGFGISNPAQAARVAEFADAVIVGSALSLAIEANLRSPNLVETLGAMVGAMKDAMTTVRRGSETSAAR